VRGDHLDGQIRLVPDLLGHGRYSLMAV
jgi:hypothetical protein